MLRNCKDDVVVVGSVFCQNETIKFKEDCNMKVIIFGATGGIGKWAVKYALEKGYDVTVFVRNAKKVQPHEHLTVIEGQIFINDPLYYRLVIFVH